MLDKLFVRVRSWLHNDPTGVIGDPALPAPPARDQNGRPNRVSGKSSKTPVVTPPPLPPDAWKEAESGMVITESGIIIIDPNALDAAMPPSSRAAASVPADSAWAMPTLPKPGSPVSSQATAPSPAPMSASSATSEWDEVLARAKARIATDVKSAK